MPKLPANISEHTCCGICKYLCFIYCLYSAEKYALPPITKTLLPSVSAYLVDVVCPLMWIPGHSRRRCRYRLDSVAALKKKKLQLVINNCLKAISSLHFLQCLKPFQQCILPYKDSQVTSLRSCVSWPLKKQFQ